MLATGPWHLPGVPGTCDGARFHSPTPLFVQDVCLVSPDWGVIPANAPRALLCGTCRDNLAVLQQMMAVAKGGLPWTVRREWGNDIRALAQRGWLAFTANQ